jgi:hypothetical protein
MVVMLANREAIATRFRIRTLSYSHKSEPLAKLTKKTIIPFAKPN